MIHVSANIIGDSPYNRVIAADADGNTKNIAGRPIRSGEFGLLRPSSAAAHKNIGRPLIHVSADIIGASPYNRVIAADADGIAKLVEGSSISSGEFGLLGPSSAAAHKNIGRTLIHICADIIAVSPYNRVIAADADGPTKRIAARSIRSGEFVILLDIGGRHLSPLTRRCVRAC